MGLHQLCLVVKCLKADGPNRIDIENICVFSAHCAVSLIVLPCGLTSFI